MIVVGLELEVFVGLRASVEDRGDMEKPLGAVEWRRIVGSDREDAVDASSECAWVYPVCRSWLRTRGEGQRWTWMENGETGSDVCPVS